MRSNFYPANSANSANSAANINHFYGPVFFHPPVPAFPASGFVPLVFVPQAVHPDFANAAAKVAKKVARNRNNEGASSVRPVFLFHRLTDKGAKQQEKTFVRWCETHPTNNQTIYDIPREGSDVAQIVAAQTPKRRLYKLRNLLHKLPADAIQSQQKIADAIREIFFINLNNDASQFPEGSKLKEVMRPQLNTKVFHAVRSRVTGKSELPQESKLHKVIANCQPKHLENYDKNFKEIKDICLNSKKTENWLHKLNHDQKTYIGEILAQFFETHYGNSLQVQPENFEGVFAEKIPQANDAPTDAVQALFNYIDYQMVDAILTVNLSSTETAKIAVYVLAPPSKENGTDFVAVGIPSVGLGGLSSQAQVNVSVQLKDMTDGTDWLKPKK